jgi:hypothetical protein
MRSLLPLVMLMCFGSNQSSTRETVGYVSVQEIILNCENNESCESRIVSASGSATRILWKGNFYWLSAGHVCESLSKGVEKSAYREMKITSLGKKLETAERIEVTVFKNDDEIDICLMKAKPGPARILKNKELEFGEKISTFAFPDGFYAEGMYPLYEGTYNGKEDKYACLTSIPVSPGSSGAGIVNKQGNVVGVVTSVSSTFNHRTIFVCPDATMWFVSIAAEMLKNQK